MKRWLFCFALLAAAACGERQSQPQQLVVMTMNMRYDNPEDGENNWRFRRERIAAMLREQAPDVFGTQELLANQYDDLGALLPDYRSVGVGREDGDRAGEFNAVFFRADAFELLDSGTFWLSEEPERPGSKGWDGACERLATWVVLRRGGDGREFLFINTHLDHVGEQARREGVALLLRRIETLRGDRPVILTGDFNAEPYSPAIAHVVEEHRRGGGREVRAVVELCRLRADSRGGASPDRLHLHRRRPAVRPLRGAARPVRGRLPLGPRSGGGPSDIHPLKLTFT